MTRPQFGMVLDGVDQQIECVVRMGWISSSCGNVSLKV
jgi:hypothetical protein